MSWSIGSDGGIRHVEAEGNLILGGESSVVSPYWTYVAFGTITVISEALSGQGFLAEGTISLSGSASTTPHLSGTGNIVISGESDGRTTYRYIPTGQLLLSSSANSSINIFANSNGTTTISGGAIFRISYFVAAENTIIIGGNANNKLTINYISDSGLVVGNIANYYPITTSVGIGNITLLDEALAIANYIADASGIIYFAGTSLTNNYLVDASGSINLLDEAYVVANYIYSGDSDIINISGSATFNAFNNFAYLATGNLQLKSAARAKLIINYISSGNLELKSDFGLTVVFKFTQDILWNVNGIVEVSKDIVWDTGEIDLYWYRIEGKPTILNSEATGIGMGEYGLASYMQIVAARGLYDLAEKLTNGILVPTLTWPIESVKRYSCPVYLDDPDAVCEYIEEDIRHVPKLLELSLDFDAVIYGGANFEYIEIDSPVYSTDGSKLTLKSATTYYKDDSRNYYPEGNLLNFGGEAIANIISYNYIGLLDIIIRGEAELKLGQHFVVADGNISLLSSSRVSSTKFDYLASGLISLSGLGSPYFASGDTQLSGEANVNLILSHLAKDKILLQGECGTTSSNYNYNFNGNLFFGGATAEPVQEFTIYAGADFDLYGDVEAVFANNFETDDNFSISDDVVVSSCSCDPLPIKIYFNSNINNCYILKEFLARNSFTFSEKVILSYNTLDNVWRNTFHFNDSEESWKIIFEWGCINEFAGTILSKNLWKLSVLVTRKNKITLENSESRILTSFPLSPVCTKTDVLRIDVDINTETGLMVTDPTLFVDSMLLTDGIGLFKGKEWLKNPMLFINIREVEDIQDVTMLDISSIFPEAAILTG